MEVAWDKPGFCRPEDLQGVGGDIAALGARREIDQPIQHVGGERIGLQGAQRVGHADLGVEIRRDVEIEPGGALLEALVEREGQSGARNQVMFDLEISRRAQSFAIKLLRGKVTSRVEERAAEHSDPPQGPPLPQRQEYAEES